MARTFASCIKSLAIRNSIYSFPIVSSVLPNTPFHGKASQSMSQVRLLELVFKILSKVPDQKRNRKNDLGKVVCFSSQDVKSSMESDSAEATNPVDDNIGEIIQSGV